MADSLSKVVALIIAVFILFVFPMKNEFERQDETSRMLVLTETTKFVDSVRNLGYITPAMYMELTQKLGATNNIYEIKMEHYAKRYDPLYEDPKNQKEEEKGKFNVNYQGEYTKEIMKVLFPDPALGIKVRFYKMSKGDYFAVKVVNKNKTMATKMQEMLYNADFAAEKIMVNYGGMIKDETY